MRVKNEIDSWIIDNGATLMREEAALQNPDTFSRSYNPDLTH